MIAPTRTEVEKQVIEDTPELRVISLGWGVQSWTLAAMVGLGELPPVDFAIHSDTGHERAGTYSHAAKWTPWLEARGVKVRTVSGSRTDVVRQHAAASVLIPAFTSDEESGKRGQVRRQCTREWKIRPMRRFIRGILPGGSLRPGAVESWQGISLDEWQRMRDSDVAYITNKYPLVEARITRADCITWLDGKGLDIPVKSACTFCPYHNAAEWQRMKRAGGPDWIEAVEVDQAIRSKRASHGRLLYVHSQRSPLPEAVHIPRGRRGITTPDGYGNPM